MIDVVIIIIHRIYSPFLNNQRCFTSWNSFKLKDRHKQRALAWTTQYRHKQNFMSVLTIFFIFQQVIPSKVPTSKPLRGSWSDWKPSWMSDNFPPAAKNNQKTLQRIWKIICSSLFAYYHISYPPPRWASARRLPWRLVNVLLINCSTDSSC